MSLVERPDTMIDDPVTWQGGMGSVGDYVALLKPRVMSLVIFTAFVGMMLAPGSLHPVVAGVALLCIAIGAGASGALNMWYDADIDRIMSRTAKRPIPAGKITPDEALAFGMTLSIGSVVMLGLLVNWFAGAFLAFTIFFYAVIYTMWLKRSTPQNIVIGGAAGAFPPMIGWASVTGSVSLESVILFLIIFMWTPPHFWALALFKSNDYRQAGVPMLPVVAGEDATRTQILLYSLVLVPLAISPWPLGFAGPVYGIVAIALGAGFLGLAWRVYRHREGDAARKAAVRLFSFSILYLFLLFALLLGESLVTRMM
ncbi:heme o synthase [Pannonibacter tanglangensis]|uniref:Protoheme IX farnesyltransferase n=1 Tax=Pannonibacter tanglangensis TaxID=2750084 RepID=A0ABW9ZI25_9HYPH|nr:heme o synthase [Pannonibacter sp. XCT-34]NBN64436.1 protoheme IX farnesyltransferase [Pannonibacter sp. XCT-34]